MAIAVDWNVKQQTKPNDKDRFSHYHILHTKHDNGFPELCRF